MNLKFINSETEMELSKNFIMSLDPYKRRLGIQKRYGKDGGVKTGDQMVDSRDLTLEYQPIAEDDITYRQIINSIIGFFNINLHPFYIVDTDNFLRAEIALKSASNEADTEGLEYRIGKNKLEFEMLDGHWEDEDETIDYSETGGMATSENITIDNDSDVDCYPIFRIVPYESNPEFTIRNLTTAASFTLGSTAFVPGTEFIIDAQLGTIYLSVASSQIELSSALADGSGFIKFIPGNNQLEYSSLYGLVDIEIEYRKRYAF